MTLKHKSVKKTFNKPGANFGQVKEFLNSIDDAPDDAYVSIQSYYWSSTRIKWVEVSWDVDE